MREERLRQVEGFLFGEDLPPSGSTHRDSGSCKQREKRQGIQQEGCRSPEHKKAKGQAPIHQEMEALQAEIAA